MTDQEIQDEIRYRKQERLGLLCFDGVPTAADEAAADADIQAWLLNLPVP